MYSTSKDMAQKEFNKSLPSKYPWGQPRSLGQIFAHLHPATSYSRPHRGQLKVITTNLKRPLNIAAFFQLIVGIFKCRSSLYQTTSPICPPLREHLFKKKKKYMKACSINWRRHPIPWFWELTKDNEWCGYKCLKHTYTHTKFSLILEKNFIFKMTHRAYLHANSFE